MWEPQAADEPRPGRRLAVRLVAVVALAALAAVGLAELMALRSELAFARFYRLRGLAELADEAGNRAELSRAVRAAAAEGELVMAYGQDNMDALRVVSASYLTWGASEGLDPMLRLRLGEKAVTAGALAVLAAPSDYEAWIWLARAQAALGLGEQAARCLVRAQQLAPPGKAVGIFSEEM